MRIAQICPPWLAVPPKGYGGIEWVVALLADGLAEAGHDVTLFATGDSRTKARLEYVFEEAPGSARINDIILDTTHTLFASATRAIASTSCTSTRRSRRSRPPWRRGSRPCTRCTARSRRR